jgi:hypothetical protein
MKYGAGRSLLFATALAACSSTKFTPSGPPQAPKGPDCDFQVFTAVPAGGFAEIGTIDYSSSGNLAINALDEFKARIRPDVCRAGGDAVLAVTTGGGYYYTATVLKAGVQPSASSSGALMAPTDVSTANGGCRYDAQCKGTRICVKGECVDPPEKK